MEFITKVNTKNIECDLTEKILTHRDKRCYMRKYNEMSFTIPTLKNPSEKLQFASNKVELRYIKKRI